VQALAGCLAVWDFAVTGITNESLRAWMTRLRGVPYTMTPASYDLARLRGNGLIERITRTNTYRLTADGLTFALVYSRVHDQVLYPLTAHDQPVAAPPQSAPRGGPSSGISTAPSPPPSSGAQPEAAAPCSQTRANRQSLRASER